MPKLALISSWQRISRRTDPASEAFQLLLQLALLLVLAVTCPFRSLMEG